MDFFSKQVKAYISLIVLLGTLLAVYIFRFFPIIFNVDVILFTIMAIIAESLLIPLPNQGGVTVGFAIILPCIIFFGPGTTILVILLQNIFLVIKQGDRYHHIFNTPFYKTIFNISMYCISAGASALTYVLVDGYYNWSIMGKTFVASLISALVYIFINGLILARLLAFVNHTNFMKIWVSTFRWAILNFIAISGLSVMIVLAYAYTGIEVVILLFGPLLLARYSFKLYLNMKNNFMETIQALSAAIEQKDPYTQGHSQRVCDLAEKLGQELKLRTYELEQLRYAAILHDIGKIGIPESILNKPGSLTREEFDQIKNHPLMGVNILQKIDFLKEVTLIMQNHHEYYDGSGYPEGKAGDRIPFLSRIITLADAYDAMTSDRPYRAALSPEHAIEEIQDKSGSQFDPQVVRAFLKLYKEGKVGNA